jgi:hypothetical protein
MAFRPAGLARLPVIVLGVFLAQPASATTVVRMNLEEMATASPSIVHGTVISTESKWNEERSLIVTDVRIRVLGTVKGDATSEVVVRQPGGVVGKLKVEVPGMSVFRPDDEVVLFLAPGSTGQLHVNGLTQGRFDVIKDSRTGEKTIRGLTPEQMTLLSPAGALSGAGKQSVRNPKVSLDQFLDGVRHLVLGISDREANR